MKTLETRENNETTAELKWRLLVEDECGRYDACYLNLNFRPEPQRGRDAPLVPQFLGLLVSRSFGPLLQANRTFILYRFEARSARPRRFLSRAPRLIPVFGELGPERGNQRRPDSGIPMPRA